MPDPILDSASADIFTIRTTASGPTGALPFTGSFLKDSPSGDVFGWTQDAGMGWDPSTLGSPEFLMLSTSGGIRNFDGNPYALVLHTGSDRDACFGSGRGRGASSFFRGRRRGGEQGLGRGVAPRWGG